MACNVSVSYILGGLIYEFWRMTVVQNFIKGPYGEDQSFRPKTVDRTSAMDDKVWNLQYSPVVNFIYKFFVHLRQGMSCKAK